MRHFASFSLNLQSVAFYFIPAACLNQMLAIQLETLDLYLVFMQLQVESIHLYVQNVTNLLKNFPRRLTHTSVLSLHIH